MIVPDQNHLSFKYFLFGVSNNPVANPKHKNNMECLFCNPIPITIPNKIQSFELPVLIILIRM